ncbi:replication-associated protein [McMurdo Ice Shelf pond-associated circular DNA virus-1]|uniref:replication-associated protein n=1 Tax=McMurdo Ice Shelf pond-associated circular DNA virus-1 TaxID=1521385 RepID=UPI0004D1438C|nr:replication-associated protein [McMurdo Ice Shelf pond-associated circular DNA virus-1]AIF71501.1 replication-associated protein [McMurdo Ice Shelf pond-associated circular DNA virus-1]
MSQGKHWQFTLNNPTQDERNVLAELGDQPTTQYLIYGDEVGASGTPHLQGHVSFVQRYRFNQVKNWVSPRAHLELVRLLRRHIEYCKKDGAYLEFGTPPDSTLAKDGKRNELAEFRATVAEGVFHSPELREKHPNVMARYPHFANSIIRDLFPQSAPPDLPLRAWQQRVVELIDAPPDPRKVYFIVDRQGNAGKTSLAKLLHRTHEAVQIIRSGKVADMAYLYKITTKILILDVPRSKSELLQYSFIEMVKDGLLMSTKYESVMKTFDPPHILVMMNADPDHTALSTDRYHYIIPH